jgi:CubicO group peptidase (beta-lactamase class C family)
MSLTSRLSKISDFILSHHQHASFIGSVLISIGDSIVFSQGYGFANIEHQIPNDPLKTVYRIASCSKHITAIAILKLVEEGKLRLEDPIDKWFSEQRDGAKVTVHQLLCQSSGE